MLKLRHQHPAFRCVDLFLLNYKLRRPTPGYSGCIKTNILRYHFLENPRIAKSFGGSNPPQAPLNSPALCGVFLMSLRDRGWKHYFLRSQRRSWRAKPSLIRPRAPLKKPLLFGVAFLILTVFWVVVLSVFLD